MEATNSNKISYETSEPLLADRERRLRCKNVLAKEEQAVQRISNTAPAASRSRILIAEDNADMLDYLRRLLADEHEVIAVADGEAALAAALAQQPDLVLSDVIMPIIDGYELVRRLRAESRSSGIPIILLSARAAEEALVEGLERGADDYLIKPFSARELLARVNTHLELARVRKAAQEALRRSNEELEVLVRGRTCELKEANAALRESREQLDGIINSAMDAIIAVDAAQRVVLFNPAAENLFGVVKNEALGSSLDRFIPARFRRAHRGHVEQFGRTGVTTRRMGALGALSGLRANGEEFPIEASISQAEIGGGNCLR